MACASNARSAYSSCAVTKMTSGMARRRRVAARARRGRRSRRAPASARRGTADARERRPGAGADRLERLCAAGAAARQLDPCRASAAGAGARGRASRRRRSARESSALGPYRRTPGRRRPAALRSRLTRHVDLNLDAARRERDDPQEVGPSVEVLEPRRDVSQTDARVALEVPAWRQPHAVVAHAND